MPVVFHPEALWEMQDAAQAYEDQNAGFGHKFLGAVEEAIELLVRFPSSGRDLGDDIRSHSLRRFPFSVVYEAHHDGFCILAVAHHRRAPGYWRERR